MTIDLSINDDILNPDNYSMITVEMFTHRIIEIYSHIVRISQRFTPLVIFSIEYK